MSRIAIYLPAAMACLAGAAQAACPESMLRDPTFVTLAVAQVK